MVVKSAERAQGAILQDRDPGSHRRVRWHQYRQFASSDVNLLPEIPSGDLDIKSEKGESQVT